MNEETSLKPEIGPSSELLCSNWWTHKTVHDDTQYDTLCSQMTPIINTTRYQGHSMVQNKIDNCTMNSVLSPSILSLGALRL